VFKYNVLFIPLPPGSRGDYFPRHTSSFHVLRTNGEFDKVKKNEHKHLQPELY